MDVRKMIFALLGPLLAGCAATAEPAPWIEWDPSTRVLVRKGAGYARMVVCLGDREAKNFGQPTHPFPADALPQLWNSLFVKDARTLTAVSDAVIGGVHGIWTIDGKIRPEASGSQ